MMMPAMEEWETIGFGTRTGYNCPVCPGLGGMLNNVVTEPTPGTDHSARHT